MNSAVKESESLGVISSRLQHIEETGSRVDLILGLAHAARELRELAASMLAPMKTEELAEVIRWL